MSKMNLLCALLCVGLVCITGCESEDEAAPVNAEIVGFGDEQALTSIDRVTGCFAVRYQFVENGQTDFFVDGNIEYMDVQPMGDGRLVRNFLVLPDQTSFLHFTQEWTPLGDGQWQLRVSDGAGNIRYESEGAWRFNQWEGDNAPAVKPNRDMERTDYEVLERRNHFQFTDGMIIHSQSNVKSLDDGTPVASELGWIVYTLQETDDSCGPAIDIAGQM